MTQILSSGIQMAMQREARLADDPIGPEPAKTADDKRAHFHAAGISAGTVIELHDGVRATVEGVVPSDCEAGFGADVEQFVHISGTDPRSGEFRDAVPASMVGGDLARGRKTVISG